MPATTDTPRAIPTPIAAALQQALAGEGAAHDRLLSRLHLLELTQRFHFAVLAARHCATGEAPGPEVEALLQTLRSPALEAWTRANAELATRLAGRQDVEATLKPLVALHGGDGSQHWRAATDALLAAWQRLSAAPGDRVAREAERMLDETDAALIALASALCTLPRLTPLWLRRKERLGNGTTHATLWVLDGAQPRPISLSTPSDMHALPTRATFLPLGGGQVLSLGPYVHTIQPRGEQPPAACLLAGWDPEDRSFLYSAPNVPEPVRLVPQEYASTLDDLRHLHHMRDFGFRQRALEPDLADALAAAVAANEPPTEPARVALPHSQVGAAQGTREAAPAPSAGQPAAPGNRGDDLSAPQAAPRLQANLEDGTSSSDLVLRCYAPQPVAHAYARTSHVSSDGRAALGWQLGFVDVTIRFLLAVLTAQRAGLGLLGGEDHKRLKQKLTNPSLGDFCRAAEGAARALVGQALDPRAQELVALYLGPPDASGEPGRSEFALHLQALVELRNEMVHMGTTCIPPETMAQSRLVEAAERIKAVCSALRVLRNHPVLYVKRSRRRADQSTEVELLRFVGMEPDRIVAVLPRGEQLPDEQPFLLLDSGTVLLVSPFLAVTASPHTGFLETQLLYRWNEVSQQLEYDTLEGGERAPLQGAGTVTLEAARAALEVAPAMACWVGAVSPECVEALRGSAHQEGLPEVPGYRLERRLGSGTSSTVFLARATDGTGGPVAIKLLERAVSRDKVQLARLAREHAILRRHPHPHMARVLDFLEAPRPALVMEHIVGEDISQRVARGPIAPEVAARLAMEVLDALSSIHARNIFHRDVKPANVLIDTTGRARLIDLGTAKVVGETRLTLPSDVLGTIAFAAPEQLERGTVSAQADLYAVGRLLAYMVAGRITAKGAPLAGCPAELEAVIARATAEQPEDRWASAEAMREELARVFQASVVGAGPVVGDRVGDRHVVQGVLGVVEDIQLYEALEVATGEAVTLAVAGAHSRGRLLDLCQRGPRQLVRELGLQVLPGDGGLVASVFDAGVGARQRFEAEVRRFRGA
jgi:hypothetical protein